MCSRRRGSGQDCEGTCAGPLLGEEDLCLCVDPELGEPDSKCFNFSGPLTPTPQQPERPVGASVVVNGSLTQAEYGVCVMPRFKATSGAFSVKVALRDGHR